MKTATLWTFFIAPESSTAILRIWAKPEVTRSKATTTRRVMMQTRVPYLDHSFKEHFRENGSFNRGFQNTDQRILSEFNEMLRPSHTSAPIPLDSVSRRTAFFVVGRC